MSEENKELEYDEEDSVKYIQASMPDALKGQLTSDDINYLVDLIYEYYEDKGFLSDDADEEVEIDEEDLVNYVIKNAKSDNIKVYTQEQIQSVIEGELSYCDTLDMDSDFED